MSQEQDALGGTAETGPVCGLRAGAGRGAQKHGPILEDEVPYLASKATSLFGNLRRNAVRLLALSRAPSARWCCGSWLPTPAMSRSGRWHWLSFSMIECQAAGAGPAEAHRRSASSLRSRDRGRGNARGHAWQGTPGLSEQLERSFYWAPGTKNMRSSAHLLHRGQERWGPAARPVAESSGLAERLHFGLCGAYV